jgi:hypothetical protein
VIMGPSVATERRRSTPFPPLHGSHYARAPRAVLVETDVTWCPAHTELRRVRTLPLPQQVRETSQAIVGAITGSMVAPSTLLLGRYDDGGRFQYVGRTTTLAQAAGAGVAGLLAQGRHDHPWTGWSFSSVWSSQEKLNVTLVEPALVVEVGVDVAHDASGRSHHPARRHRARPDLSSADVPA